MSTIALRRATRSDLPALGRLGALLMQTHYTFDANRFLAPGDDPAGGYSWFLATQLDLPDVVIFVAERDDSVVGYVYAGLEPLCWKELRGPAGFIHDIVVDDTARRSGVATQLIDAAIEWLRQYGAPRVMLWTAAQNESAQRLFTARGFRNTMLEMTLEIDPANRLRPVPP